MGNREELGKARKGLTVEDLSDLSGIEAGSLRAKLANPRSFTITEVAEVAPHIGETAESFVLRALIFNEPFRDVLDRS